MCRSHVPAMRQSELGASRPSSVCQRDASLAVRRQPGWWACRRGRVNCPTGLRRVTRVEGLRARDAQRTCRIAKFAKTLVPISQRSSSGAACRSERTSRSDAFSADRVKTSDARPRPRHSIPRLTCPADDRAGRTHERQSSFLESQGRHSGLLPFKYMVDKGCCTKKIEQTLYTEPYMASAFARFRSASTEAHGKGVALTAMYYLRTSGVVANENGSSASERREDQGTASPG